MQASNLAVQISNLDNKHFCLPWQTWDSLPPAIKEPQNWQMHDDDDDKKDKYKQMQHKDTRMANIELLYPPYELHL